MPAKWARLNPAVLAVATPMPGGTMIMATAAKKHITLFVRSRRAKGAGRADVKAAFTAAAHGTLGDPDRASRNAKIAAAVKAAGLRTGVYRRMSRAGPRSSLYRHVYETRPGVAAT